MICHAMPEHTAPFAAWQAGWGLGGAWRQAGPVQGTAGQTSQRRPGGYLAAGWLSLEAAEQLGHFAPTPARYSSCLTPPFHKKGLQGGLLQLPAEMLAVSRR